MSSMKQSNNKTLDVVGIGNAIVDVLVKVEDSFLETHNLQKGSMVLIDQEHAKKLYSETGVGLKTSGGSAANTLAGLAQLGGKAGFIGRINNDDLGEIFRHDIRSVGAEFNTPPTNKGPSTARCLILVTADAQRTMCTYLGASIQLEPKDIDLSMVNKTKVLYLEGYLWDSPAAKQAFIEAAETARKAGGQVALTLSDSFCVDRHRESFLELVNGHIDILFANEDEITALHKSSCFESAAKEIKGLCQIVALTRSEKGSMILTEENQWEIPAFKLGPVIDTTGAGDLYAGGFLYGYTQGANLINCGMIGSLCAGQVVTQLGPRPQVSLKELIATHLE